MIRVAPAAPAEQQSALRLLFNRLPPAERRSQVADVVDARDRGQINFNGLLVADEDGARVGAALYVLQEDRTAFVWPPGLRERNRGDVADALLLDAITRIEEAGAWIAQCLINPGAAADAETLSRNGLKRLTELRFLVRLFGQAPGSAAKILASGAAGPSTSSPASEPLDPLRIEIYQPGTNDSRFARLIEETYEQTRDCPELQGRRTGEQSLVSHRMSGAFDPSRWSLFEWQGRDAGVLLLNDHPSQNVWEVVYMGVGRSFRGRGLGRRMIEHAMSAAQTANRSGLTLAVDQRNEYANRVYDSLGFVQTDTKAVHVYFPKNAS